MGRPSNVDVDEAAKKLVEELQVKLKDHKFAHLRNITRGDDSVKNHFGCGADTAKKIHILAVKILKDKGYEEFNAAMGRQTAFCLPGQQDKAREEEIPSTLKKFKVYSEPCEVKVKQRERQSQRHEASSAKPKEEKPAKRQKVEKNPYETHELPDSLRKKQEREEKKKRKEEKAETKKKIRQKEQELRELKKQELSESDSSDGSSSSSSSSSTPVASSTRPPAASAASSSSKASKEAAIPGSAVGAIAAFLSTEADVVEAESAKATAESPTDAGKEVEAEAVKPTEKSEAVPKQISILVEGPSQALETMALSIASKNTKPGTPAPPAPPVRSRKEDKNNVESIVKNMHILADTLEEVN